VKLVRPFAALVVAAAALMLGAPLVASVCVGGDACPCPGMAAGGPSRCAGPVVRVEMSCCRAAAEAAVPSVLALVAPAADAAAPAADLVAHFDAQLRPISPAIATAANAANARAERRHDLGIFTLHAVFLI
jgi:hypothetical protein